MAFGLAVYASQCGLLLHHARLASSCWSGSTGRAFHPHGSAEWFQRCRLTFLVYLALPALGAQNANYLPNTFSPPYEKSRPSARFACPRPRRKGPRLPLPRPSSGGPCRQGSTGPPGHHVNARGARWPGSAAKGIIQLGRRSSRAQPSNTLF